MNESVCCKQNRARYTQSVKKSYFAVCMKLEIYALSMNLHAECFFFIFTITGNESYLQSLQVTIIKCPYQLDKLCGGMPLMIHLTSGWQVHVSHAFWFASCAAVGQITFLEPLPILVSVVHCKRRRPSVRILQIDYQLTVGAYKSHRYYSILLTTATHDTIF